MYIFLCDGYDSRSSGNKEMG